MRLNILFVFLSLLGKELVENFGSLRLKMVFSDIRKGTRTPQGKYRNIVGFNGVFCLHKYTSAKKIIYSEKSEEKNGKDI